MRHPSVVRSLRDFPMAVPMHYPDVILPYLRWRWRDRVGHYVRSERAGHRVMERVTRFVTQKLKLRVNEAKSAVARPQDRRFLGFSFTAGPDVKRSIAPHAVDRFKNRIREITRRAKGVSRETTIAELAPYMRGWRNHFGFCETPRVLVYLTRWVRLRVRAALWRQWETQRRRRAVLVALGVRPRLAGNTAGSGRGPWYLAKAKALSVGLSNAFRPAHLREDSTRVQSVSPSSTVISTASTARWPGRDGS